MCGGAAFDVRRPQVRGVQTRSVVRFERFMHLSGWPTLDRHREPMAGWPSGSRNAGCRRKQQAVSKAYSMRNVSPLSRRLSRKSDNRPSTAARISGLTWLLQTLPESVGFCWKNHRGNRSHRRDLSRGSKGDFLPIPLCSSCYTAREQTPQDGLQILAPGQYSLPVCATGARIELPVPRLLYWHVQPESRNTTSPFLGEK